MWYVCKITQSCCTDSVVSRPHMGGVSGAKDFNLESVAQKCDVNDFVGV